jgi:hypothetical protein
MVALAIIRGTADRDIPTRKSTAAGKTNRRKEKKETVSLSPPPRYIFSMPETHIDDTLNTEVQIGDVLFYEH